MKIIIAFFIFRPTLCIVPYAVFVAVAAAAAAAAVVVDDVVYVAEQVEVP